MVALPTLVSQCQGFHSVPPPQALSCQLCLHWLQHNRRSHCTELVTANTYMCSEQVIFYTLIWLEMYPCHCWYGLMLSVLVCNWDYGIQQWFQKLHSFPSNFPLFSKIFYVTFNADSTVKVQWSYTCSFNIPGSKLHNYQSLVHLSYFQHSPACAEIHAYCVNASVTTTT